MPLRARACVSVGTFNCRFELRLAVHPAKDKGGLFETEGPTEENGNANLVNKLWSNLSEQQQHLR